MPTRATLEQAELYTRTIAQTLGKTLPAGWHFTLVLATPEAPLMTYASNLERAGSIKMLRELADSIENREPQL